MPVAANSSSPLATAGRGEGWWLRGWAGRRVLAVTADRSVDADRAVRALGFPVRVVEADQVHSSSVAIVGRSDAARTVGGCDALLTDVASTALLIRTADCLPLFFADAGRAVIGIAHAGWRGLRASLPARVVASLRHAYGSRPADLRVAIGPAIRACCYEVGPEFAEGFEPFVREEKGRRVCDLVGVAVHQLVDSGVRPERILDSRQCTACRTTRWFSRRREGERTGRLASLIAVRP